MPAHHPKQARHLLVYVLLYLLIGSLLACDALPAIPTGGTPTSPSTTDTASNQGEPPLNAWSHPAPGIELRSENWKSPGNNEDKVTIARLDPKHAHLSVGYKPDQPLTLNEWMRQTHALAVINGGYFDEHNRPTGLLVSNGQFHGSSYRGFGGMLSVDAQGKIDLRSLSQQPYDPDNEQLQQATQSSPMLMSGGKRTAFNANAASDRRSVVAIDKQGRLLLIVSPNRAFSLDELADLLASSDLSIQIALNLDGGASTGLYVNAGNQNVAIDAITTLPIVIVIKA